MEKNICRKCAYFRQHYGMDARKIFWVCCGHCTHSKVKRKLPDAAACEHFVPGTVDTEAFATKEYLSKELLKYVLNLPLLPDIEDMPAK